MKNVKIKFPVNTKVVRVSDIHVLNHKLITGTVIAMAPDNQVVVEWYGGPDHFMQKLSVNEIIHADKANEKRAKVIAYQNKIEEEFVSVRIDIAKKMETAAALIREADQIAHNYKKTLDDLQDECASLYSELDAAGISTYWQASQNC